MKDHYLFLYPVRAYFEAESAFHPLFDRDSVRKLFEIIDARYRRKGIAVNWLLFSSAQDMGMPDRSNVPDYVDIRKSDGIAVAGVTFGDQIGTEGNGVYADSDFILKQLGEVRRLTLGGFHQWDCVNRVAARAYEKGIDTFVDEDTTELFFGREHSHGIPLIRTVWNLRELGIPEYLHSITAGMRKEKPWLVQT